MPNLQLDAFCLIHQQEDMTRGGGEPSWTLSYRSKGETGYNVHVISAVFAKRLMAIFQGEEDEGGFTIPVLPQKLYSADKITKGLMKAIRSTNLAVQAGKAVPERVAEAAQRAREALTATILAGIAGDAL